MTQAARENPPDIHLRLSLTYMCSGRGEGGHDTCTAACAENTVNASLEKVPGTTRTSVHSWKNRVWLWRSFWKLTSSNLNPDISGIQSDANGWVNHSETGLFGINYRTRWAKNKHIFMITGLVLWMGQYWGKWLWQKEQNFLAFVIRKKKTIYENLTV